MPDLPFSPAQVEAARDAIVAADRKGVLARSVVAVPHVQAKAVLSSVADEVQALIDTAADLLRQVQYDGPPEDELWTLAGVDESTCDDLRSALARFENA